MEVGGKLHALAALSPGQKRPVRQWTPIAGLGAVNKIFCLLPTGVKFRFLSHPSHTKLLYRNRSRPCFCFFLLKWISIPVESATTFIQD